MLTSLRARRPPPSSTASGILQKIITETFQKQQPPNNKHHPPIIHPSSTITLRCSLSPEPCRETILEFPVDAQHLSIHRLGAEARVVGGQVGAAEAVAEATQGVRPVLEDRSSMVIYRNQ